MNLSKDSETTFLQIVNNLKETQTELVTGTKEVLKHKMKHMKEFPESDNAGAKNESLKQAKRHQRDLN